MDGKVGAPTQNTVVARNASFNFGAKAFSMLSRLMMPPIILSYVTLEEYGIWASCFILIGYLGMSTFGVSNVYITYVAKYQAKRELTKINHLLSTGLTVVLVVTGSLLTVLWFGLPAIIKTFHISAPLHETAAILIFGTALVFAMDLSLGAFGFVLQGLQRFGQQTLIWCGFVTSRLWNLCSALGFGRALHSLDPRLYGGVLSGAADPFLKISVYQPGVVEVVLPFWDGVAIIGSDRDLPFFH
jgi:O-antigen/teichoic acid export membrane protein